MVIVLAVLTYWLGMCNASAFYDPGTQRWLNRDPIQEDGAINLYQYTANNPMGDFDAFGWDVAAGIQAPSKFPTGPTGVNHGTPVWNGNGPPPNPGVGSGRKPCSQEQESQKMDPQLYEGDICPDGSRQKCQKWLQCDKAAIGAPGGHDAYAWMPHSHCSKCPAHPPKCP